MSISPISYLTPVANAAHDLKFCAGKSNWFNLCITTVVPSNDNGMIFFWKHNFSNFSNANLKTDFNFQSNDISLFINHTSQANIWWNKLKMIPEFYDSSFKIMIGIWLDFEVHSYRDGYSSCPLYLFGDLCFEAKRVRVGLVRNLWWKVSALFGFGIW